MSRGPAKSTQRQRLEADLPAIEARLREEKITYADLAREYGLSIAGIKKTIAYSGRATKIQEARKERCRAMRLEAQKEGGAATRARLKKERLAFLKRVLARGGTLMEAAHRLGMNKGNLSRLAKQEGVSVSIHRKLRRTDEPPVSK